MLSPFTSAKHTYNQGSTANGDGFVDINDVIAWAVAFGSEPGDSEWNPNADVVQDNIIDIHDGVSTATNYGKP